MKLNILFASLLILCLFISRHETYGQPKLETDIKTIINGKVWVPKTSVTLGEQFFLEKMNLKGSFLYYGLKFNNLKFSYDISNEEIITSIETAEKTKRNIIVNPYNLEGFSINEEQHTFDFLRGDLIHQKLDPQEYYQVVKCQNLRYVIKRTKLKKLKSNHSNIYIYSDFNSVFIVINGELITVRGKKDILNIFPQQKKEINHFLRNNKLKIRSRTPMNAIPLLLKFDI